MKPRPDATPTLLAKPGAIGACPICGEERKAYLFVVRGLPVARCPRCGLVSLSPAPSPGDLSGFYDHAAARQDPRLIWTDSSTERDVARHYVEILNDRGLQEGQILLIAPPGHSFAAEARTAGFDVAQKSLSDEAENDWEADEARYDAAVISYQLEKLVNPAEALRRIHRSLRPGGVLLVTTPCLDSWSAHFFGDHWTEWRPENRHYFDRRLIQALFLDAGFVDTWVEPERRLYTLRHVADRAAAFPKTALTGLVTLGYRFMPPLLRDLRVRLTSSGVVVTGRKAPSRARELCSIVVPAFNERETFGLLMESLLAKQIPGVDKEIIVVESNSSDGTRELALGYQHHPEVTLVLEDRPRGKGHAVRAGLARARGDIVMIQDADLEYDLNDYDALVESLVSCRSLFVLGARHGGSWKMRQFGGRGALSTLLNFGHVFFTTLINVLYGQRMRDPFTMFKVFRRDCLYGVELACNRFDFDHELVIKLVRKGYRPLEIPVNYRSRSFAEGKKIRVLRDPLTWLWIDLKLRFVPPPRRPKP